jgi:hypothetical protein
VISFNRSSVQIKSSVLLLMLDVAVFSRIRVVVVAVGVRYTCKYRTELL